MIIDREPQSRRDRILRQLDEIPSSCFCSYSEFFDQYRASKRRVPIPASNGSVLLFIYGNDTGRTPLGYEALYQERKISQTT
jgi:hypothetical protein